MKKKVISLLTVAAMVAVMVVGCGGSNSDSGSDTKDDASSSDVDPIENLIASTDGTVSLEVWCSETAEYQAVMQEIIDEFEALYPDVDFDITLGACSESDAKDTVLADIETAADVFVFADDQVADLVSAGALNPVSATYTYDPAETNSESTVEAATVDGQLYAYPLTASNGYFLYYNAEYLTEEDCASWESLLAAAEEAGKKVGIELTSGWYLYGFFAGAGLELSMNDDGTNSCNWNDALGVDVANAIMELASSEAFISTTTTDAMAMLPDGDLIALVDGTWDSTTFEDEWGDNYAACKLPTFTVGDTEYQMGSYAGYKFVGVNAYSDNTGWAMLLAEYITSESSQLNIGLATGEGPANLVAAAEIDSPALSALAAQSEFADQQVVANAFWDPATSLAQNLVEGGVDDMQALLDEAVAGITQ